MNALPPAVPELARPFFISTTVGSETQGLHTHLVLGLTLTVTDGVSGYVYKLATIIKLPHRSHPFLYCFLGVLVKPTISKAFDPYGSRQNLFQSFPRPRVVRMTSVGPITLLIHDRS